MSISYTLKKSGHKMMLYDDCLCPVMSDAPSGHILEMDCIDVYNPIDILQEIELLNQIYHQAMIQDNEIAELMSANLGMRNCDFSIETDDCKIVFDRKSFTAWRIINNL